jgi:hypothetical protein
MNKLLAAIASLGIIALGFTNPAQAATDFTITELAVFDKGSGAGGAEIAAYHKSTQQVYITNGRENKVDIVSIQNPENPTLVDSVDMSSYGDGITAVAAGKYVVAVSVHRSPTFAADGTPTLRSAKLVVMYPSGRIIRAIDLIGSQPDSVGFTPDGMTALVAIEGEPICAIDNPATAADESTDYSYAKDPKGAVAIVDLSNPRVAGAKLAGFSQFKSSDLRRAGIVLSLTSTNPAVDLEPEYISAVSNDEVYVTLQEANGIGLLDVKSARFTRIFSAGSTDMGETAFDLSDRDNGAGAATYDNVYGLAMPDAIAAYQDGNDNYFVTANEGDDRADWSCFAAIDDVRVKDLEADPSVFTTWETIKASDKLGRVKVNPNIGDSNGDGLYEKFFLLSNRSFSIFKNNKRIFDSGDLLETLQVSAFGQENINGQWDEVTGEYLPQNRSDDKGPEAEGVTVGMVGTSRVAVIAMERMSALLFVDITNPEVPVIISWEQMMPVEDVDPSQGGLKWSPEGMLFIDAADSPNGEALVISSYEMSGTLAIHQLKK